MRYQYAVLVSLVYILSECSAQLRCPPDLDKSVYVRRGEFVRRKDDCFLGYRCFRGELVQYNKPCANDSFYSLSTGVCTFEGKSIGVHYGVKNCEEEVKKFDLDRLAAVRKQVCSRFDNDDDNLLFAGDPESCVGYFNCKADISEDFYLICHYGTRFYDDRGRCDWITAGDTSCTKRFGA